MRTIALLVGHPPYAVRPPRREGDFTGLELSVSVVARLLISPDAPGVLPMGDVRADARGPRASASSGKRVARHAAEQTLSQPYVGRRVARPVLVPDPAPAPKAVTEPATPYVGRRVARVVPEPVLARP